MMTTCFKFPSSSLSYNFSQSQQEGFLEKVLYGSIFLQVSFLDLFLAYEKSIFHFSVLKGSLPSGGHLSVKT